MRRLPKVAADDALDILCAYDNRRMLRLDVRRDKSIAPYLILRAMPQPYRKSFRPRVVRPVRINGKIIDEDDAYEVLSYATMFALIVMVSILAISFFETDLELGESITAVISSINNVGPGVGRIGPAENYGFMNGASKIFLSVLMIMGRLEFYAVLALFMPSLWRKFQ